MATDITEATDEATEAPVADTAATETATETAAPIEVNQKTEHASVKLTDRAAQEITRVMTESGMPEGTCVRIGVRGGGCSGFQYSFNFDDTTNSAEDFVSEQHGIFVAVNKMQELHLAGTEVDFYEDLDRRGFVFNNPNVTKSCGCGSSFSA